MSEDLQGLSLGGKLTCHTKGRFLRFARTKKNSKIFHKTENMDSQSSE